MKAFYLILIVLGCMYMQSCTPKGQTPTYIHVDSFNFVRNIYQQGSSSHRITSFWVYYNGQPVGVFGLPVTIPVLTTGSQGTITVAPGITVDGINAFQTQYSFYSDDTMMLTTAPGKITNYIPKTGYDAASHFKFVEDFESTNGFIKITGNDSIVVTTDSSLKIEGHASGYLYMQSPDTTSESIYTTLFPYPTGPAFIELDYKNTINFQLGVEVFDADGKTLLTSSPDYIIGVNNSSTVNKIYLTLTDFSTKYEAIFPNGQFRFAIKGILPAGQNSGYLVIDNVKLVTTN